MPLADGPALLRNALRTVVGPNLVFWILPWAGLVVLWWVWRLNAQKRFLLCALLVCSLASASVGLYFRGHYFIPVLPVLGLLIGVAVSRAVWLLRHDRTLELMLAFPILLLFAAGIIVPLSGHGALWFTATPEDAVRAFIPRPCSRRPQPWPISFEPTPPPARGWRSLAPNRRFIS
jgi:CHASE2 domain-containing sensor protein